MEPRFNEPLDNGVLGITDDADQPDQSYNKMYGETSIEQTSIKRNPRYICSVFTDLTQTVTNTFKGIQHVFNFNIATRML